MDVPARVGLSACAPTGHRGERRRGNGEPYTAREGIGGRDEFHASLRAISPTFAISSIQAAALQINHADDHGASWVERQILETPSRIEAARGVVERVREDAEAADILGGPESGAQGEQKQRTGIALPLVF